MKLIIALLLLFSGSFAIAQKIDKKVEAKTKQRANTRVDQGIDKGLDKVEEGIGNIFKKKNKKKKKGEEEGSEEQANNTGGAAAAKNSNGPRANAAASDFVPGATVIFEDKFEKDALSDFPAQWNTNGSGKLVTIEGLSGKWLDIQHNSTVNPVLDKALPENSTIEFDLFLQSNDGGRIPIIVFGLTPVRDILKEDLYYSDKFYASFSRYDEPNSIIEYGMKYAVGNKNDFKLNPYNNKVLHVAMAINKTRIRLYLDGTKIVDLPRALTPEMRKNFFITNGYVIPASELGVLVSNLRIASADVDARSLLIKQLMDEGKAVTNDILFDVNSDVIKQESFAVINQFGDAMKTNPGLKIKITGHTDSDGADAANLTLSQKRAAAVKKYITTNYGVDAARIQTDGKGETIPVAANTTADGKAKNRRVEFTKL